MPSTPAGRALPDDATSDAALFIGGGHPEEHQPPVLPDDLAEARLAVFDAAAAWHRDGAVGGTALTVVVDHLIAVATESGEVTELRALLLEVWPVLKGFCDATFTPDGSEAGYAEVTTGYTPQGIHTFKKVVAACRAFEATPKPVEPEDGS